MTDDTLAAYARRNVPRYTSYPTAPHFHDGIGADEYGRWLAEIDPQAAVSLYLHVPFCRKVCWYCGCNMKLARRDAPIADYVDSLMREIKLVADRLPARMTLTHLHWGGGTPTVLSPDQLGRVMDLVRKRFDLAAGAELAIESDPRTLSVEMTCRIGWEGFTRASFGVQEFDLKVQTSINRVQPPAMVRAAVDGLREAGVGGINFDLLYGLPHQTESTLLKTIDLSIAMSPDRIAMFGYAHVPWMAKRQRRIDEAALPGPADRRAQAEAAASALRAAGYEAIGLDHFAREDDPLAEAARTGTLRRNFQGYTTDRADVLIGVGATAIGRTASGHVQNIAETGAWARAIADGRLPVARGVALTDDDRLRGHVIEALMCAGEVNLGDAAAQFGAAPDWYGDVEPELEQMEADGLIRREGARLAMMPEAASLVRVVAAAFDARLAQSRTRHAVAV